MFMFFLSSSDLLVQPEEQTVWRFSATFDCTAIEATFVDCTTTRYSMTGAVASSKLVEVDLSKRESSSLARSSTVSVTDMLC